MTKEVYAKRYIIQLKNSKMKFMSLINNWIKI